MRAKCLIKEQDSIPKYFQHSGALNALIFKIIQVMQEKAYKTLCISLLLLRVSEFNVILWYLRISVDVGIG